MGCSSDLWAPLFCSHFVTGRQSLGRHSGIKKEHRETFRGALVPVTHVHAVDPDECSDRQSMRQRLVDNAFLMHCVLCMLECSTSVGSLPITPSK